MLIQFKFNNIYSFYKEQTFSMVSAPLRASKSQYSNMLSAAKNLPPLLLSSVVYGANASGKSNFVKTIDFFLTFINESSLSKPETIILVPPFLLNTNSKNEASSFEIIFVKAEVIYRYGFELNSKEIRKEWLYVKTERESLVFQREGESINVNSKYKISRDLAKKKMIRKNALLLSVAAQFNEPIAITMFEWFQSFFRISGFNDSVFRNYTQNLLKNDIEKLKILSLLKNADLGIEDILLKEQEGQSFSFTFQLGSQENVKEERQKTILQNLITVKNIYNKAGEMSGQIEMNFDAQESEGTQKLFHLSGLFFYLLEKGGVMLIDEFDAKLHPLLTIELITIINNPAINIYGAQLIFTTHNTNLLAAKIFRRDQVWFTEKNRMGESLMFSLYDFKQRNDSDIEKNYTNGRFGAIPYLNNLKETFQNSEN